MVLNNLILSLIDCKRDAINDPHLHFNNRADGAEEKVGYIVIAITL